MHFQTEIRLTISLQVSQLLWNFFYKVTWCPYRCIQVSLFTLFTLFTYLKKRYMWKCLG